MHTLSHPFSLAFARGWAAMVSQFRRDVSAVHEHAEGAVALATAQGFPQWAALGTIFRGWALAMQGQGEAGWPGSARGSPPGGRPGQRTSSHTCAPCWRKAVTTWATCGWPSGADEAHTLVEQQEERWWKRKSPACGASCSRQPGTPPAEAEAWLQRVDVACRQEAKSLELRAAMSLARLWQQQGKRTEARELLAPIYGWFTEGFDTADLQEAKALLEALT